MRGCHARKGVEMVNRMQKMPVKTGKTGSSWRTCKPPIRWGFAMHGLAKGRAGVITLNESSGLRTVGIYHGEFDPGSERTLAACLKHASRAARVAIPLERRTGE